MGTCLTHGENPEPLVWEKDRFLPWCLGIFSLDFQVVQQARQTLCPEKPWCQEKRDDGGDGTGSSQCQNRRKQRKHLSWCLHFRDEQIVGIEILCIQETSTGPGTASHEVNHRHFLSLMFVC